MSRRNELPTTKLTVVPEISAVTNEQFSQLSEDRIIQQLHTARDLTIELNGLPKLLSISRQETPVPLEQNPHF